MLNLLPLKRVEWAALLLGTVAVVVFAIPISKPVIPIFDQSNASLSSEQPLAADFSQFEHFFDFSSLPDPAIETPPPKPIDPFRSIRQFSLVGVALTEGSSTALISGGGGIQIITTGDMLGDFTVMAISARQISLRNDDLETVIRLETP